MFSSVATMIGNIGQSAYVAANGFMEALAVSRNQEGLPGLAIGWGAVMDVGYLDREKDKAEMISKFSGSRVFNSKELLTALGQILVLEKYNAVDPVLTVTPMSWSTAAGTLKTLSSPSFNALTKDMADAQQGGMGDFRKKLEAMPVDQLVPELASFIQTEILNVLRTSKSELSMTRPISDFGIDSLMGVEFAMTTQEVLGNDIPLSIVSSEGVTINDIAEKIGMHILSSKTGDLGNNVVIDNLAAQHIGENTTETRKLQDQLSELEGEQGSILN